MKRLAVALVMLAFVVGCGKLTETPGVDFEMKSFKAVSPGGCTTDTTSCASFEVNYPEFFNLDTTVQRAINDRVNYLLGGAAGDVRSLTALGNDFIRDFDQFVKEMPSYGMGWYFKGRVTVLIATDTLISLQVDVESFTGGAHGSFATNYVNVEPKTGTNYLLDTMLKSGYQDELYRLGEEDLLRQLEGSDTLQIENASIDFKLNDNYGFRPEGIVYYFNDYELASYAEGPTEILIPYEELRGWFK